MKTLTWILLYGVIILLELPTLIKDKKKKELTVYSLFIGLSLAVSLLLSFGIKIPSIDGYIGEIVKSITGG